MMNSVKLNYGGELKTGDFIGVAYGHYVAFGWYVQPGADTVQYLEFRAPKYYKENHEGFEDRLIKLDPTHKRRPFVFKNMRKDYVMRYTPIRVFKISDPDEFMKGSNNEPEYLISKQILLDLKFLKEEQS